MWLTSSSIRRPVFIVMFWLALIVMGLRSRMDMKVELNPKIDLPYVTIMTTYPGAGPEEIETLVTKPLEEAIGAVNNIKNVTSVSQDSLSIVTAEFYVGTDLDSATSDIREKVDSTLRQLPQDADHPTISKLDIGSMPVMMIGLSSHLPLAQLKRIADDVVKDRLGKVPGVAAITLTGGETREIRVALDRGRLESLGLTVSDVARAVSAQNLNLPSGDIDEGKQQFSVRTLGEFQTVDEVRDLRLQFSDGQGPPGEGVVVKLSELGRVLDTVAKPAEITRVQRKPSIGVLVQKSADANTVDVCNSVKRELSGLKQEYGDELEFVTSQDDSKQVKAALEDVNMSLILGVILVVLTIYLFLHNIRGTFIVGIAIPACLVATFLPMKALGFTMNQMTMLALSLVVGILVDDSIVVIENIFRHLHLGEGPRDAALNGRTEIGLAALAITMTDVVVFVPIAFMGGIVGQFFRQFGITVAVATLFSLLCAFTLTPMLASRWFRRGEQTEPTGGFGRAFDRFYRWLDDRYRGVLRLALRRRFFTLLLGLGALVGTLMVFGPRLGFEFFPSSDEGKLGVTVEMPQGTTLRETNKLLGQVEEIVFAVPEVENVFTNVGRITGGFRGVGEQGPGYGQVSLKLVDKVQLKERVRHPLDKWEGRRHRSDQEVARELRQKVAAIPGADLKVSISSGFGGTEAPVQIELRSNDMAQMLRTANAIKGLLAKTEGIRDPDISWRTGKPEVQVRVDREKAAAFDFSVAKIAMVLRDSFEGNTDTKFREAGEEYDIRVQLEEADRNDVREVENLVIGMRNHQPVRLRELAQVSLSRGPNKIDRKNRQRQVTVLANLEEGYPLGNMQQQIQPELDKTPMPGILLHWGGRAEVSAESNRYLLAALLLSVLLVYMLMAALFESFLNPFIIMFSLPMALVGAIAALAITGKTLSIIAMIGIIMLMGLVTKNAILLLDYTNTLRARGVPRNDAILEAGPVRLRPVLMTTTAMILGMLPIAIGLGEASETRAPMAICVIGGMIVSTLLTLVLIPVTYTLFDDLTRFLRRLFRPGTAA